MSFALGIQRSFLNYMKQLILQVDFSTDSIEAQGTNISQVSSYFQSLYESHLW